MRMIPKSVTPWPFFTKLQLYYMASICPPDLVSTFLHSAVCPGRLTSSTELTWVHIGFSQWSYLKGDWLEGWRGMNSRVFIPWLTLCGIALKPAVSFDGQSQILPRWPSLQGSGNPSLPLAQGPKDRNSSVIASSGAPPCLYGHPTLAYLFITSHLLTRFLNYPNLSMPSLLCWNPNYTFVRVPSLNTWICPLRCSASTQNQHSYYQAHLLPKTVLPSSNPYMILCYHLVSKNWVIS